MSDEIQDQDVNTGEDRVTADHDAGIGSSADEMETHNPDHDDFDRVLKDMETDHDADDDSHGDAENTDDSDAGDGDGTGTQDDDPRIPKSRFDEVNERMKAAEAELRQKELDWTREKALFEGRLAALEKAETKEVAPIKTELDSVLERDPQDILDAFQEDPANFVRMIQAQAKIEAANDIQVRQEEAKYQEQLQKNLEAFTSERDDFMSNADKLVGIVEKDPIHNIISAYAYEIEIPKLQGQLAEANKGIDDKIAAAKKEGYAEGRKKAIAEIKAKGAASVLDGSQSSGGQANAGAELETGGDPVALREKITADLLKKRAATG
jgi:hypothetical protein